LKIGIVFGANVSQLKSTMMKIELDNNQKIAILGTFLFSVLVMLLLLMIYMKPPYPPKELPGMEVMLGYVPNGGSDNTPQASSVKPTPTTPIETPDQTITSEQSDVEVDPQTQTRTEPKVEPTVVEPDPEPVRTANDRLLFNRKNNSSDGRGGGTDEGDEGSERGDPNANNSVGPGGIGDNWKLDGRQARSVPKPNSGFTEEGKVRVKIWVDRNGRVTTAVVNMKGTNTTSKSLHDRAVAAAKRAVFNVKSDAPNVQIGYITYNFTLQN
jgi:TonB family protein